MRSTPEHHVVKMATERRQGDVSSMRQESRRTVRSKSRGKAMRIVKAVAKALTEHRRLNASLEGDQIVQHAGVHVGVAVSLDDARRLA